MNYRKAFSSDLRHQGRSKSTIKHHSYAVAEFITFLRSQNHRKSIVRGLQLPYLEAYKHHLMKTRQLRPSSINRRLAGLSSFARFLLGRHLLRFNPLDMVPRIKPDGTSRPPLEPCRDAVEKLRQVVNHDVLDLTGRLIVELLYTGMTVKELCSLRISPPSVGPEFVGAEQHYSLSCRRHRDQWCPKGLLLSPRVSCRGWAPAQPAGRPGGQPLHGIYPQVDRAHPAGSTHFNACGMKCCYGCSIPTVDYADDANDYAVKRPVMRPPSRTLHPEAQLALEHYMILRPILMGDRLLVGKGPEHSIKPGTIYNFLRRLSRKIGATVSIRQIRLAQFITPVDAALAAA